MTTIVYRDGVLAADRRAYSGQYNAPIGSTNKINVITGDGVTLYCGFSTNKVGLKPWLCGYFHTVLNMQGEGIQQYLKETASVTPQFDFTGLLVKVSSLGKVLSVAYLHNSLFPIEVNGEYFAIGTGAAYALGAMSMGADAVEAVQVACIHDVWSGVGIDSYNVLDSTPTLKQYDLK